jgi:hypothetical protein
MKKNVLLALITILVIAPFSNLHSNEETIRKKIELMAKFNCKQKKSLFPKDINQSPIEAWIEGNVVTIIFEHISPGTLFNITIKDESSDFLFNETVTVDDDQFITFSFEREYENFYFIELTSRDLYLWGHF